MIKILQILIKKGPAIPFYKTIHSDNALLASFRRRKVRRAPRDDFSAYIKKGTLRLESDHPDEALEDYDLDNHLDMMKDEVHDEDVRGRKVLPEKVKLKITAKKFFSSGPQPSMLTWNERLCIQYLHKEDPVQWNLETLSESFPATPDIIRKVLRSKRKITPELAKKLDIRVQRNWQLLSEGKLEADPAVLKHLKKFVNRREVLLEQIQNEKFYLPKVKKEPIWNQGEMQSIISNYEKSIKKLAEEDDLKSLTDGSSEVKEQREREKSSIVSANISNESEVTGESKDSVIFGEMINTYKKPLTLEELESKILRKAERSKKLNLTEKAILDNKLGFREESYKTVSESSTPLRIEDETNGRFKAKRNGRKKFSNEVDFKSTSLKFDEGEPEEYSTKEDFIPPDDNTFFGGDADVGKIINQLQNKPEPKVEKKEIDFTDPERINRENAYFEEEVLDIKNTAFWNSNRSNQEKVVAESNKIELNEFSVDDDNSKLPKKIFLLHPDPYPERIKIPKNKRGSGLTFRVKDCYYDDDGMFLYRVPGMTK